MCAHTTLHSQKLPALQAVIDYFKAHCPKAQRAKLMEALTAKGTALLLNERMVRCTVSLWPLSSHGNVTLASPMRCLRCPS